MARFTLTEDELKFLEASKDIEISPANIKSTQRAVQQGRHSTLIYPASGYDILRVVLGYDIDIGVFIDSSEVFRHEPSPIGAPPLETILKRMGIPHKVARKRRIFEVEADLNGKTRQIIGVRQTLDLSDEGFGKELENLVGEFFKDGQIDILYTFWVFSRNHNLLPEMYNLIRQDGFYVTEEGRLPLSPKAERVVNDLLHLYPHRIAHRLHGNGFLYKKTGEADELVTNYLLELVFGNQDIKDHIRALGWWRTLYSEGRLDSYEQQNMQKMGYPACVLQDPTYRHILSYLVHRGLGNIELNAANLSLSGTDPSKVDTVRRSTSLDLRRVQKQQYK